MKIARMIAPIHSLGPGDRVGLWVQGCSKKCFGCISEELQLVDAAKEVPVDVIATMIINEASRTNCTRLTISGGDPFEQPEELFVFLKQVRRHFTDILVYTGYTMEEIRESEVMTSCLCNIDVLVDGRYIESKNVEATNLRGSSNQRIFFLTQELVGEYTEYEKVHYSLETFVHNDKFITIGIQRRKN